MRVNFVTNVGKSQLKDNGDGFWVDASGVPLNVATPPSNLIIKYRAIRARNEIPAGNISGSAVYI